MSWKKEIKKFDDDEDDEELTEKNKEQKLERALNGAIDSQLKGLGIQGAVIAGVKNALITIAKEADKKASNLDGRLAEIEELRVTAKREKAEAELAQLHPDFSQIREDDAFHTWAEGQPQWIQNALYENTDDAKSVARVIDLYKTDKGITTNF